MNLKKAKETVKALKIKEIIDDEALLINKIASQEWAVQQFKEEITGLKRSMTVREANLALAVKGKNDRERESQLKIDLNDDEEYSAYLAKLIIADTKKVNSEIDLGRYKRVFGLHLEKVRSRVGYMNFLGGATDDDTGEL